MRRGNEGKDPALETRLAARLEAKKKELDSYRPIGAEALKYLQEELELRLTYNSNAIEGNSLTMAETQLVGRP